MVLTGEDDFSQIGFAVIEGYPSFCSSFNVAGILYALALVMDRMVLEYLRAVFQGLVLIDICQVFAGLSSLHAKVFEKLWFIFFCKSGKPLLKPLC